MWCHLKTKVIKDVKELEGKTLIVTKGTTAETCRTPKYQIYKSMTNIATLTKLCDGRGDAFSTQTNTEVLAWALENKGYEVGIISSSRSLCPSRSKR